MWKPSLVPSNRKPLVRNRAETGPRVVQALHARSSGPRLLSIEGVSVSYGGSLALRDISFALDAGEIVGLIGPNGAGKSSLLKAIVGLVALDSGQILNHGRPVKAGRSCTAYVSQRESIDWSFPVTVFDVVLMGRTRSIGWLRRPSAVDREIVWRSLEHVGMRSLGNRQIGDLSGGEQQRVMLARALAQGADLLLLDEPFRGLDVSAQEGLLATLRSMCDRGCAALVATHDLGQAAGLCDRLVLLNTNLVAVGSPGDVLTTDKLRAAYGSLIYISEDYVVGVGNGA